MKTDRIRNISFDISPVIHIVYETDFYPGSKKKGSDIEERNIRELFLTEKLRINDGISIKNESESSEVFFSSNEKLLDLKDFKGVLNFDKESGQFSMVSEDLNEIRNEKRKLSLSASSVTSSNASFNHSHEAKSLLFNVTRSLFKFKVSFLTTIIIVNIVTLVMMVVLILSAKDYFNGMIMNQLVERAKIYSYLSLDARILELTNEGYLPITLENESRTRLKENSNRLDEIILLIKRKIDDMENKDTKLMFMKAQKLDVFFINKGKVSIKKSNLLDAMSFMNIYAQSLYLESLNEITFDNPTVYFLIKNGIVSNLDSLHESNNLFIQDLENKKNHCKIVILMLGVSANFLMFLCFFIIIMPTIFSVEKSNQTV